MSARFLRIVLPALAVLFAAAPAAAVERFRQVYKHDKTKPGYYWMLKANPDDPVVGLTKVEAELFKTGITEARIENLMKAYVDRTEDHYAKKCKMPEGFLDWLQKRKKLRRTFWIALDPHYDNVPGAVNVLDELRRQEREKVDSHMHLAVAMALVWDDPDSVWGSRYKCVHALKAEQYEPLMDMLSVFRFFTSPANVKRFLFSPQKLVWPILVYLVNFDVNEAEARLVLRNLGRYKRKIGALYQEVKYDYSKLNGAPKLGSRPYTIFNLLKYGGICGDQAHCCTRTAKCFGIPAMKVSGLGRYGGSGHAFAGFFVWRKGRAMLDFAGRYWYDYYYTGNVFDPHTRTEILDRTVAMMLDGATLDYGSYLYSMAQLRIAHKVFEAHPAISLELTKRAITLNHFYAPAWRLLIDHLEVGTLDQSQGLEWANKMAKYLKNYPDLTIECLSPFLACIPTGDVKARQSFYRKLIKLYRSRPDIQIVLRERQAWELWQAKREKEAFWVYIKTSAEHGKEGRILLKVVKNAAQLAKKLKLEKEAVPYFKKMVKIFPQVRSNTITRTFQDLVRIIYPIYDAAGETDESARLRRLTGV
jgi:hypothetical protein